MWICLQKRRREKTFLTQEHYRRCHQLEILRLLFWKEPLRLMFVPSTQRPTLPIRHKNSQKNTALSLYWPSCRQRALRWQVDDNKTTALQGSPGKRGEGEENGPSKRSNSGSVQREQIYILINKTTICMTLEEVSAQKRIQNGPIRVWGEGWGGLIQCEW